MTSRNKILIGVPTAEYARRADFYDYFNLIDKPDGTIITFSHGQSPAMGRNVIIEQALNNDCTHILFLDDDVIPQPDIIERLIRHDKDIVTGLYLMRNFPHQPIIFDYTDNEGRCSHHWLRDDAKGLVKIVAAGLGACLIHTDVFRALEKPWIRLGELAKDGWCDDIGFFKRAREAGFELFCDLDVRVGHMASVTIWPDYLNGKWVTHYDTKGTGVATILQAVPELKTAELKNTELETSNA